jgi:VIT1/CCC1 family predicted Fe2+/Mn2+ transporter
MIDTSQEFRERSIPELMKQLSEETSTLVRQEIDLAKAELAQKARIAAFGVGGLGAAGLLGLYALAALSVGVIAALALAMPVWAAALIVTATYSTGSVAIALTGRRRLRAAMPPAPETTVETVKEDVRWAKTRWRFGRR